MLQRALKNEQNVIEGVTAKSAAMGPPNPNQQPSYFKINAPRPAVLHTVWELLKFAFAIFQQKLREFNDSWCELISQNHKW